MQSSGNGYETEEVIFDVKQRSTWPEIPSGDGAVHELTPKDLAMKLHYIRALYFFKKETAAGLAKAEDFSDPWSALLNMYSMGAGRIRRYPGRAFVKCNDAGVRYLEARCSMTLDQWLKDERWWNHGGLLRWEPIGPNLEFSPLLYLQITRFECGGVAVGLSWAHVLGDASSVISLMNLYGRLLSGHRHEIISRTPPKPPATDFKTPINAHNPTNPPLSIKRVAATETDHWVIHNSLTMETHVFLITPTQMDRMGIAADTHHQRNTVRPFHLLSALIWKTLATIKRNTNTRSVTIICPDEGAGDGETSVPGNRQRIYCVSGSEEESVWELADRMARGAEDESEDVGRESGDVVVYGGGGLTFVDLEDEDVYGMEIRGQKAAMVSYGVEMVGDEGVVVVLPGPGSGGRMVNVALPASQLAHLRNELITQWGI